MSKRPFTVWRPTSRSALSIRRNRIRAHRKASMCRNRIIASVRRWGGSVVECEGEEGNGGKRKRGEERWRSGMKGKREEARRLAKG